MALAIDNPDLSREEKETRVLFPETHTREFKLLGQRIELRPLPIGMSKRISVKMAPLSVEFDKTKTDPDSVDPDLDLKTVDTLLDCAVMLVNFYKVPLTRELLEEEETIETILAFLDAQVSLSRDNNFLLQSLRQALRMVDWTSKYLNSPMLPFTPPTVSDGESGSTNLPATTPSDSFSSSPTE